MTDMEDVDPFDPGKLTSVLEGILSGADPEVLARCRPGFGLRRDADGLVVAILHDREGEPVELGRFDPGLLRPDDSSAWVAATPRDPARPPEMNLPELLAVAIREFPGDLRERWVAALNAGQYDIRLMASGPLGGALEARPPREPQTFTLIPEGKMSTTPRASMSRSRSGKSS